MNEVKDQRYEIFLQYSEAVLHHLEAIYEGRKLLLIGVNYLRNDESKLLCDVYLLRISDNKLEL